MKADEEEKEEKKTHTKSRSFTHYIRCIRLYTTQAMVNVGHFAFLQTHGFRRHERANIKYDSKTPR